jgi:hypothetical protein
MTFTKLPLSASSYGQQILISATTSASANPIHTSVAGTSAMDEIWLYAYNDSTASVVCSILWGGTMDLGNVNRVPLQGQAGRTLIVDGKLLQNGLTVYAYASSSNWVSLDGFINRIQ